jgi:ABC-type multidrug transport system fused ATPase/permease subunit
VKQKTENFSWGDVVKAIWYFLQEDKKKLVYLSFILLFTFGYLLVPAYIVGKIIDFFSTYQKGQSLSTFYGYLIFLGVVGYFISLIRLKTRNMINIISHKARTRVRTWGFERLTEFSLEWHNKENTGNKLQRIFTGADAVIKSLRIWRADVVRIIAGTLGMTGIFLVADFKLVAVVVIYATFFIYIELKYGKKIFKLSNEFNQLNQKAGGTYVEGAHNMLSVKAMGNEKGLTKRVFDREMLSQEVSINKAKMFAAKWRYFHFFNNISLALFLYLLGVNTINGLITLGSVLVFYSYFYKFQEYLTDLSELHMDLIDLKSDIKNMMPIFWETEFIKTGSDPFPHSWNRIEMKNVSMDYGSGQMGLNDFNLVLGRNTKTGVAGLSGSGKSTLAKIILGLYAIKSGEFKIGNKNYYDISHNDTLSHITVVLQETELFNLSLRENITMMRGEDESLLNMAISISELGGVIDRLPEGLDAKIGEKGYMLSGGERQRLGIARAIYKNSGIIILDEATSSLDSETEGKIMEKLLGEYGKDKTFLIIAHRLGTLKYTDNIAVMDRGSVVEEGSYDELMNNDSSVFHRMNQEQHETRN